MALQSLVSWLQTLKPDRKPGASQYYLLLPERWQRFPPLTFGYALPSAWRASSFLPYILNSYPYLALKGQFKCHLHSFLIAL